MLRYTNFAEGSELEHDHLTSMRNYKTLEVRFHTLLTQNEPQQLEVVRA
jgi:hypothetical protein